MTEALRDAQVQHERSRAERLARLKSMLGKPWPQGEPFLAAFDYSEGSMYCLGPDRIVMKQPMGVAR